MEAGARCCSRDRRAPELEGLDDPLARAPAVGVGGPADLGAGPAALDLLQVGIARIPAPLASPVGVVVAQQRALPFRVASDEVEVGAALDRVADLEGKAPP